MKKILAIFAILGLAATVFAAEATMPKDFKLKGLTRNKTVQFKNLPKDVTVMQFWASWCTGCSQNMDAIMTLQKKMKGTNFNFMPVSVDESKEQALSYFDNKPNNIKDLKNISYLDVDTKLATNLDISSLPALIVLDSNGKIVSRMNGHLGKDEVKKLQNAIKGAE